jgi:uncharacterized protein YxeA
MNGITLICLVYILVVILVGVIFYYQRKTKTETKDDFVKHKFNEKEEE